jgi:hypothetical protein
MTDQLNLGGDMPTPPERPLTDRQQHALHIISQAGWQGITSDELGAHLHQYRQENGGKGHTTDHRCDWCSHEGQEAGKALHTRGLIYRRERLHWTLIEHRDTKTGPTLSGYDPRTAPLPEGF